MEIQTDDGNKERVEEAATKRQDTVVHKRSGVRRRRMREQPVSHPVLRKMTEIMQCILRSDKKCSVGWISEQNSVFECESYV